MVAAWDVASRQVRRADGQGGLVRRDPGSWGACAAYDRGATSRADGLRVGPVTLLDTDELDDRDTARRALGLPLDRRLALVALGAGNINDTSHETGATVAALRRLGVEICVTQTPIADADRARSDVHVVREFPLSAGSARLTWQSAPPATTPSTSCCGLAFRRCSFRTKTRRWTTSWRAEFAADRGLAHARADPCG